MEEMRTIVLDNDRNYMILDEKIINDVKYTLFSNVEDEKDICFRKTVTENGEEFYVGLDDEKEFELVAMKFLKSYIE